MVHHQSRASYATPIAERLHADMVTDNDGLGCEATHRLTWKHLRDVLVSEQTDQDNHWCVIIEDDIVPIPQFTSQLIPVLQNAPTDFVSLYLGKYRPPHWQLAIHNAITSTPESICYYTAPVLFSAQGYAVRPWLLSHLLLRTNDGPMPIDEQISAVLPNLKTQVSYCWPSIVDHNDSLACVIKNRHDEQPRPKGRTAWNLGARKRWTPTCYPIRTPEQLGITVVKE